LKLSFKTENPVKSCICSKFLQNTPRGRIIVLQSKHNTHHKTYDAN